MSGKRGKQAAAPPAAFTISAPAAFEKPKRERQPKAAAADGEASSGSQSSPTKQDCDPIFGAIKVRQAAAVKDEGMCLTMWQPWASLLVHGIKRFEGRTWKPEFRGRLWIHSASQSLEPAEIEALEKEYAYIGLPFPKAYPQSALLGCVDVIDCVEKSDLKKLREKFDAIPAEQRDKIDEYLFLDNSEMEFVLICVNPKRLPVPLQLSGQHKIWKLPKATHEAAKLQLDLK